MKKLEKPTTSTLTYYDYLECSQFLEKKYKYKERDFAGWGKDRKKPYQDFWHFVLEKDQSIYNGSYFIMYEDWEDGAEDWQKTIIGYYMDEFGQGEIGYREIQFYVWW